MLHERGEGVAVSFKVSAGVGGEDVDGLTGGVDDAGVPGGVGFDPLWRVVHVAVLPGAEPEDDEMHVVLAGLIDEEISGGEIEGALFGLKAAPSRWEPLQCWRAYPQGPARPWEVTQPRSWSC